MGVEKSGSWRGIDREDRREEERRASHFTDSESDLDLVVF